MAELLGIENLKKLTKFSCKLTKQIQESTSDGWQWIKDPVSFLDEAMEVPGIAKAFPDVIKEVGDLSPAEHKELEIYLQNEFDIPNDILEVVIENSVMQALSLVALVKAWQSVGKK